MIAPDMYYSKSPFGEADIEVARLADGVTEIRSRAMPSQAPATTLHWLRHWASKTPSAHFLSEVIDGHRVTFDYLSTWSAVVHGAQALRARGVVRGDRVVVVAANSFESFVAGHSAMLAGAIWVPIATQYLGAGADPTRIADVLNLVDPALVLVPDTALHPQVPSDYEVVDRVAAPAWKGTGLDGDGLLQSCREGDVAKLMLTSGSTGTPKAVVYTHRMLVSNARATADVWTFVTDHPPILVDWLPWNHAFGGNANLNMVLLGGGTLHIDDSYGRPTELWRTIATITAFEPTFYAAVPAGFHALLPALETDREFSRALFGRCDAMFSAGAAMPAATFERLRDLSSTVRQSPVPVLTGWGSTEVGPGATIVHTTNSEPGIIGPPLPGVAIRMVPTGDKLELRVKSPGVTPAYWRDHERTTAAFDENGFYRTGDAGTLVDEHRPELGLRFDGRIADDFKLANGSWVNVDRLRSRLLALAGTRARDVVIAGPDRSHLVALFWLGADETLDVQSILHAHNSTTAGQTNIIVAGAVIDTDPPAELLSPKGLIKPAAFRAAARKTIDALYDTVTVQGKEEHS
ncbi:AMP-binding protein [Prescottella equi]|uniref:AMP-binding protein n=1 Tax=Rhodococcus hoagii TaxID=43767 RepID=UPI001F3E3757|nr:AMP-binding protein [Prescottella equi]